ncbi:SIMPL domain-containing protein [Spongiimicrobium salis]|uniref:SIMPL domain-containing protein n=1 Tax=Spongiimicrobium salis TaxID=1667022 RepID=UPI00374D9757
MKKIIVFLVWFLTSTVSFAQIQTSSIAVNGSHTYSISPVYTASMIISLNNVYYEAQLTNLAELKATYLAKLEKAGIDTSTITDDALSYALLGYDKEGSILKYKTTSLESMKTFLSVKALDVTKSDTTLQTELNQDQMAAYAQLAIENARGKAEKIAQKIGRKVGKIMSINDNNSAKITESLYYGSLINQREYYISVSFELL